MGERGSDIQIEESLRNAEERYRSVVENLGEGMFLLQNNLIVFANHQASEILLSPDDKLLGTDPVQWIHADDRPSVLAFASGCGTASSRASIASCASWARTAWCAGSTSGPCRWPGRAAMPLWPSFAM